VKRQKWPHCSPKTQFSTIFGPGTAKKRLEKRLEKRLKKRLSARLALLLDVMNDRGKFHSHRTKHRGGRVELVWWYPQGRDPRWNSKMSGPCVYASQNLPQRNDNHLFSENAKKSLETNPGKGVHTSMAMTKYGKRFERRKSRKWF
jgi:hypothetical protein